MLAFVALPGTEDPPSRIVGYSYLGIPRRLISRLAAAKPGLELVV
jgi:hypothetical protein